jgi:NADH-quinone oxidoreductase subunit A
MNPTSIVAYLVLFASAGFLFVFAALMLGWLLRPRAPSPEKLETYECGEASVGSSFVQFDLRFYVVALVFIVFDVEVAFLFPWAVVFGKATQLMATSVAAVEETALPGQPARAVLSPSAARQLRQLGVVDPQTPNPAASAASNSRVIGETARLLALGAMADVAVFFVVLMVGFAYVWSRGDLDWVRAVTQRPVGEASRVEPLAVATSID